MERRERKKVTVTDTRGSKEMDQWVVKAGVSLCDVRKPWEMAVSAFHFNGSPGCCMQDTLRATGSRKVI